MILIGAGRWDGLLDWLHEEVLGDQRIDSDDLTGLHVVHDPGEVVRIVGAGNEDPRASNLT